MPKIAFSIVLKSTASRRAPTAVAIFTTKTISAKLGTRARVNVRGTINGHEFRSSMFPTGTGTHYMVVNKQMREAIGVGAGDRVKVVLEVDTKPRVAAVPPEMRRALSKSKTARNTFEKMPPSHRREYVDYFLEAKQPETRVRRLKKIIAALTGTGPKNIA